MKNVSDFNSGILQEIYNKASQLRQLQQLIEQYLPEDLKQYCKVANFRDGVLVFAVPSPAWSTKLRYTTPDLIEYLRKTAGLHQLASITYYVEPEFERIYNS